MKTPLAKNISHLRISLNFAMWMEIFSHWAKVWLIMLGIFLLAVKALGMHEGWNHHYLWLSAIPILIAVTISALQNKFNNMDAAAWLDCKSEAGGRLMALAEGAPTGELMDRAMLAKPVFLLAPVLRRIALPGVFLLAAWIIPPIDTKAPVSPEAIKQRAEIVKRRIQEAKAHDVLEEQDELKLIDDVRQAVAKMENSPEAAMEAVDQMQETLERSILKKAEQLQKAMEKTSSLASMADDYLMMGKEPSDKKDKELMEKIANALEDIIKEAQQLDKENALSPEAKEALKELMEQMGKESNSSLKSKIAAAMGKMDPQTMKSLATALSKMQQMKKNNMGKCAKVMKSADAKKMLQALLKECQAPG